MRFRLNVFWIKCSRSENNIKIVKRVASKMFNLVGSSGSLCLFQPLAAGAKVSGYIAQQHTAIFDLVTKINHV